MAVPQGSCRVRSPVFVVLLMPALSERASDLYQKRFHTRYVIDRLRSPIDTARPAVDEALLDISLDQGVS